MREFENDEARKVGGELGAEVATHVDRHGERFCTAERQRIEAANRPKVMALRAKLAVLKEVEEWIKERIHKAPPAGDLRARKRRALLHYAMLAVLTAAAFVFAVLAFEPFRLGWKSWLYCVGIAVVTPFLVDLILERWASQKLVTMLTTIAGVVALASLMLLAVVRGDIFMQQAASSISPVVVAGDAPATTGATTDFYGHTLPLLRIIMALLSLAIEVGAGIALYEARRCGAVGEDITALQRELGDVRESMIVHGHELLTVENEGETFEHEFWRDFYRSVINGAREGGKRTLFVLFLCLALFGHDRAYAAEHLNLVMVLDLSKSEAATGHDGKTEFTKNVESVTSILATVPAGTSVTVLGITDDSFGAPYVLLKAQLSTDEGYFHERLAKGRAALVQVWKDRSARLAPNCKQTDILGALLVASEVFHASEGGRKVLIMLSDMRQDTGALDLEHGPMADPSMMLRQITSKRLRASLNAVDVYALGVDAAGVDVEYWTRLRDFWTEYLKEAGATLRGYSVLREVPKLGVQ